MKFSILLHLSTLFSLISFGVFYYYAGLKAGMYASVPFVALSYYCLGRTMNEKQELVK